MRTEPFHQDIRHYRVRYLRRLYAKIEQAIARGASNGVNYPATPEKLEAVRALLEERYIDNADRFLDEGICLVTDGALCPPKIEGDAGYDLTTAVSTIVYPHKPWLARKLISWRNKRRGYVSEFGYAEVPLVGRIAIPRNHWGTLIARSSTNRTGQLVILTGLIDEGYRGKLMIFVHNVGAKPVVFEKGASRVQWVFIEKAAPLLWVVPELPPSVRGENAYGSTD